MAVTRDDLLTFIGSEADGGARDAELDALLAAAREIVEQRAATRTPAAIMDQAVLRVAALLWYHRGVDGRGRIAKLNPLTDSGAATLLAPWRRLTFGRVP